MERKIFLATFFLRFYNFPGPLHGRHVMGLLCTPNVQKLEIRLRKYLAAR